MSCFEDFKKCRIGYSEDYEPLLNIEYRQIYLFEILTDKWETRNGEVLELRDMSTKHLKNCEKFIYSICKSEGLETRDYEIYINILKELKRRMG